MKKVGRPALSDALGVWMNGERVGTWTFRDHGPVSFAYADSWLESPRVRPISLSMPVAPSSMPYRGDPVLAFFDNLLPENKDLRKKLAERHHTGSSHPFALLQAIGRDCIGAIQLLPVDSDPPNVLAIESRPTKDGEVEKLLDDCLAGRPLAMDDGDDMRISLAGMQEKIALLRRGDERHIPLGATPTTHILKLPLSKVGRVQADFSSSVENEWLCNRILKAFGLPVPDCWIETFGKHKVLVVTRFDRQFQGTWWARLPQEDFCQVLAVPPGKKYQRDGGPGIDDLLYYLRGSNTALDDRRNFLAAQLIFWLLAAPDGHAKNFSVFILPEGRFRLTPFYDVMSAWPAIGPGPHQWDFKEARMAMSVKGKNSHYVLSEIRRSHWNQTARRNEMGSDFESTITEVLNQIPQVIRQVRAELPADFPDQVASAIFDGMARLAEMLSQQSVE